MRSDFLSKCLEDSEQRQRVLYLMVNDLVCKDIIVKAIAPELEKLTEDRSAAKSWRLLISTMSAIGMIVLTAIISNVSSIIKFLRGE